MANGNGEALSTVTREQPGMPEAGSDWSQYERLVISDLSRLMRDIDKIDRRISQLEDRLYGRIVQLERELATMKGKIAVWASLAGTIVSLLTSWVRGHMG